MDNYTKQLERENLQLKEEIKSLKSNSEQKQKVKKGFVKFLGLTFAGKRLKKSIYLVLSQYNQERFVSREALSDLLASIVYRLTRIGVFTVVVALLPFILLIQQNLLLKQQNEKIQDQNYLAEASRRSTQMFIMGDVLSDINQERNKSSVLSAPLIGRIASLSLAMKPYRYFMEGELIEKPLSPERGQLLLTISKSNLRQLQLSDEIFQISDFTYAELSNVTFRSAYLKDIDLAYAQLNFANMENTNLRNASLANANLYHTDFIDADLGFVDFRMANLTGANLMYARVIDADFTNAILDSVKVHRMDWLDYIKNDLKLNGAQELHDTYKIDSIYAIDLDRKVPTLLKKSLF